MLEGFKWGFGFDDVRIRFGRGSGRINWNWEFFGFKLKLPFLSAPMDTLTDANFAIKLSMLGGVGVIHKNQTIKQQTAEIKKFRRSFPKGSWLVGAAIGVINDSLSLENSDLDTLLRARSLLKAGADFLVLDTAHGFTKRVGETLVRLKEQFEGVRVVVGNVVSAAAIRWLAELGADAIKVGIGCGSICTTRAVTGVGRPQFSALLECSKEARKRGVVLIADGGIRSGEDVVKALLAGADLVMLGSLFAQTEEALGETTIIEGRSFKYYRGMGSLSAMQKGSLDRYAFTDKGKLVAEGVDSLKEIKGSLIEVVEAIKAEINQVFAYYRPNLSLQPQQRFIFPEISLPEDITINELLLHPRFSKVTPSQVKLRVKLDQKNYKLPCIFLVSKGKEELAAKLRQRGIFTITEWDGSAINDKSFYYFDDASDIDKNFLAKKPEPARIFVKELAKPLHATLPDQGAPFIGFKTIPEVSDLKKYNLKKILFGGGVLGIKAIRELIKDIPDAILVFNGKLNERGDIARALLLGCDLVLVDLRESGIKQNLSQISAEVEEIVGSLASSLAYLGFKTLPHQDRKFDLSFQSSITMNSESGVHSVLPLSDIANFKKKSLK